MTSLHTLTAFTNFNSSAVTNANEIAKIWSPLVIEFLESNLVMTKLVTDRSVDVATKGDTIYFPKTATRTAKTYTEGAWVTDDLSANTDTNVTLTIDQAKYLPGIIPWTLEAKSKYDQKALRLREASYGIAQAIDSYIANLATGFAYNITTSSLTVANLLKAYEYLNMANVPHEGRAWVFSPVVLSDLIALTSGFFIQTLSSDEKSLMTGKVGTILGSPVYLSTNVKAATSGSPASTVYTNMYFHKSAIGFASLKKPMIESGYEMLVQGEVLNVKTLFGACILDSVRGVAITR
jgi:hypothetical protein